MTMPRILTSSKGHALILSIVVILLVWWGVPEAEAKAEQLDRLVMELIAAACAIYKIATAHEDKGTTVIEVEKAPPATPGGSAGKTLMLICLMASTPLWTGCTAAQDRQVETYQTQMASELAMRKGFADSGTIAEFDGWLTKTLQDISDNQDKSLRVIEAAGKLTAASARENADVFNDLRYQVRKRCATAKGLALQGNEWMGRMAQTITAVKEYYQTKDRAMAEGALAFLESFAKTYATSRSAPTNPADKTKQDLLDQYTQQLTGMLRSRLGAPSI